MGAPRLPVPLLTLALLAAACVGGDPEAAPATETTSSATLAAGADARESGKATDGDDDPLQLPTGFDLVGVSATRRAAPPAGKETAFAAAVGRDRADPRYLELTVFEFPDAGAAGAAAPMVNGAAHGAAVEVGSGLTFAFLPTETGPGGAPRVDQELAAHGPAVDGVVRGLLGRRRLVVGASRILQPRDLDRLLAGFDPDAFDSLEAGLPAGMSLVVDEPLSDGFVVELRSDHGTTTVEVRDGVGQEWFELISRDAGPPPVELDLPGRAAAQPASSYGTNGEPLDQSLLYRWVDDRLTVVAHPTTLTGAGLERLVEAAEAWPRTQLSALVDLPASERAGPGGDGPAADEPVEGPPPEDAVRRLQHFVESAREAEIGQPVQFDFVESVAPPEGTDLFVSSTLWTVMVALGLVDDAHDRASANQARIDRLRGTPGAVVIQPTVAETEWVVVHEMTHILDDVVERPVAAASPELLDPGQALSEGNAHRVTYEYVATLPDHQQGLIDDFPGIFPPGGDERLSPAMQDVLEFPYEEGMWFTAALAEQGGEAAIAEAFDRPPTSTEQILFPQAWFDDDQPVPVGPPDTPAGAERIADGRLGAYLLFLTLRERGLDDLEPVAAWAGDAFVLYDVAGTVCLAATVMMDGAEGATDLAAGLRGPGLGASASGSEVRLDSCAGT